MSHHASKSVSKQTGCRIEATCKGIIDEESVKEQSHEVERWLRGRRGSELRLTPFKREEVGIQMEIGEEEDGNMRKNESRSRDRSE